MSKKENIKIDSNLIERLAYDKKNKLVIRNQALFTLMELRPSQKDEFVLLLKQNLPKTSDYRAHIRLYNNLLNNDFYKTISKKEILDLIEITKSMDLGKAVESTIKELEDKLPQQYY